MSAVEPLRVDRAVSSPVIPGVPLFDNQRQFESLAGELLAAVGNVSRSGRYIFGPDCQTFEERAAAYCGAAHGVGCASGSDALLLALMAFDIGPGDEVIVPSYSFFATASAVARLGATSVFVDIDPHTFNIDPRCIAAAITPRTKAIIPVHLFGQCADMRAINELAQRHQLRVIEDACQAIGAEYQGRRAGCLADVACFSFYPTKNLGCFGDGGLLTTHDAALAERLKLLRGHGMQPRYYHQALGINSRLDSIQAAVLNVKLPHLDSWVAARQAIALRYQALFVERGLDQVLSLPQVPGDSRHVWNQYVIRVSQGERDALRQHLAERKIGSEIYYPVPIHAQACFQTLPHRCGALEVTNQAALETLALPIFPELTEFEQRHVVDEVAAFWHSRAARGALAGPKFLQRSNEKSRL